MKIRLLLLILLLPVIINATKPDYGLYIKSYPLKTSELSNLVLENGNPILLNGDIVLSFDIYIRNDNVFGNILRLLTEKNENIDLLITVGVDDKRFPVFVVNESVYPIKQEVVREQWIPVSITLSPKNNVIKLVYGKEEITIQYPISKSKNFKTAFGLCLFDGKMLENVASFNLKDIRISKNNTPLRYWKLEKHYHEVCYDSIANVPAIALNPYWLIDDHVTWNKVFHTTISGSPSVAFNPKEDEFYIVNNSKEIIAFNTQTNKEKVIQVKDGLYAANSPNQLIYIPERNTLLSYNMDEDIYSFFSFENQTWSNHTPNTKEHSYWNNSVFFNQEDMSIISFGGYGFYKYNNDLVKIYPFGNKAGNKVQLTDISPRYSSGTTLIDNTLYIFGGRGNKSGRQELFPKNFYDFYAVNLQTNQINKLWDIESVEGGDFIPSENLIYDPEKNCFYMFTIQAGGTLMKITTNTPGFELMSLPIEMDIEAQFLYSNLYYSPSQKKLFVFVNLTDVNNNAKISIYSINYPPVAINELLQTVPVASKSNSLLPFIIAIVVFIVAFAGIYWSKKHKKRKKEPVTVYEEEVTTEVIEVKTKKEKEETILVPSYDFTKSCICFLGGFHVRDKNGEDITSIFTPTLKALLILLVLYTEENKRGILGKKMLQLLWSDKNESSARNNRNVYLSKLRTLLEKVGNIDIITEGGFWSIQTDESVLCDYTEAMLYLKKIKEDKMVDEDEYNKLLELLLRGTLLPNTEIDWIDRFKSDFSNLTIDTLSDLLISQENLSANLKFRIAETLFQHDFINEDALHIKCKILSESGKMGLAKTFYDNYCREYYNLLGTKYKYSLAEVINGNNSER
ncbi:hypothetical protein [Bacteroides sp. 519]|uniref:hypothetical protein n=1 Tax=Bacteroides sp. 519 TaxID=2302937 RepID=UPI0013D47758|nr:hypothetical protein [Bacteroides sp. 519]NDV60347.1 hypothetical protein [Bacteroides sp. 519]